MKIFFPIVVFLAVLVACQPDPVIPPERIEVFPKMMLAPTPLPTSTPLPTPKIEKRAMPITIGGRLEQYGEHPKWETNRVIIRLYYVKSVIGSSRVTPGWRFIAIYGTQIPNDIKLQVGRYYDFTFLGHEEVNEHWDMDNIWEVNLQSRRIVVDSFVKIYQVTATHNYYRLEAPNNDIDLSNYTHIHPVVGFKPQPLAGFDSRQITK